MMCCDGLSRLVHTMLETPSKTPNLDP